MRWLKVPLLIIKQALSFVIYCFSFLIPRSKTTWVYGNFESDFRDNAKYFFIYANKHVLGIQHIWISANKPLINKLRGHGYKAYHRYSIKGLWSVFRAKVFIYTVVPSDIINGCCRGTAFLFNLWHGIPFKKIEYDITTGPLQPFFNPKLFKEKIARILREPEIFRRSSAVLVPSLKAISVFSSAFRLDNNDICIGPYPRNEVFYYSRKELTAFVEQYEPPEVRQLLSEMNRYHAVVIYMPTFRDARRDFINDAIPDFGRLNEVCEKEQILFLLKTHKLTAFTDQISSLSNVRNVGNNLDVYPLLPYTDALVSDYSSIFFDYSLLRKKMIFYAYDKEQYLANRPAYFTYEAVFDDNPITSFDQLLNELVTVKQQKTNSHEYSRCLSFFDESITMQDTVTFIKNKIHFN